MNDVFRKENFCVLLLKADFIASCVLLFRLFVVTRILWRLKVATKKTCFERRRTQNLYGGRIC